MSRTPWIAALLLLASAPASADFVGNWTGSLPFTDNFGASEDWDCPIGITRTQKYLYIDDDGGCLYWYGKYEIRDGALYEGETKVGTLSATAIHFEAQSGSTHLVFDATLNSNGSMTLSDVGTRTKKCVHGPYTYTDTVAGTLEVETKASAKRQAHAPRKSRR